MAKIPLAVQERMRARILAYAREHYAEQYHRLDIRFRGAFCYIDAWSSDQAAAPLHLCRLRYAGGPDRWRLDFFAYSSERYKPSVFPSGSFFGDPEEALAASAVYLG